VWPRTAPRARARARARCSLPRAPNHRCGAVRGRLTAARALLAGRPAALVCTSSVFRIITYCIVCTSTRLAGPKCSILNILTACAHVLPVCMVSADECVHSTQPLYINLSPSVSGYSITVRCQPVISVVVVVTVAQLLCSSTFTICSTYIYFGVDVGRYATHVHTTLVQLY
jgi:hypothetical protein